MTDRELLEAAAKAAGMKGMKFTSGGMVRMIDPTRPETTGSIGGYWNPLTDDGDALRLAVALHITVVVEGDQPDDRYRRTKAVHRIIGNKCELHRADPNAATRRAITRAAAEIQRQREASKSARS